MTVVVLLLLDAAYQPGLYQRSQRRLWAREQAIPEILRLRIRRNLSRPTC